MLLHGHLLAMALSGCEDPVALWSLRGLCVTVLVLASSFSHPGSLINTHTPWQLSPCPCGCFFFSFDKAKGIQVFSFHILGPACRWLPWPMMRFWSSGVGGRKGKDRERNQVPSCSWDEGGKGVGTGVLSAGRPDAQPFMSACSCQVLSSSL